MSLSYYDVIANILDTKASKNDSISSLQKTNNESSSHIIFSLDSKTISANIELLISK